MKNYFAAHYFEYELAVANDDSREILFMQFGIEQEKKKIVSFFGKLKKEKIGRKMVLRRTLVGI